MSPPNTSNQSISLWVQYFLQIGKEKYSQGNQLFSLSVLIITHLMRFCLNVKNPRQSAWKGSAACLAHLLLVFGPCTTRQLSKCKPSVLWMLFANWMLKSHSRKEYVCNNCLEVSLDWVCAKLTHFVNWWKHLFAKASRSSNNSNSKLIARLPIGPELKILASDWLGVVRKFIGRGLKTIKQLPLELLCKLPDRVFLQSTGGSPYKHFYPSEVKFSLQGSFWMSKNQNNKKTNH